MLVAVGFIVRLNVAVLIFIGGSLAWLIGIPLIGGAETGEGAESAVKQAYGLWSNQIRYVGVGAMVVGGFASLFSVRAGLWAAIQHTWHGLTGEKDEYDTQKDIPAWLILGLGFVCIALLAMVNYSFTKNDGRHDSVDRDHAGDGFLLHGSCQLYRRLGRQLQQPGFRHDHYRGSGGRRIAVAVRVHGHGGHGCDAGDRCDRLLRGLHQRRCVQ